MSFLVSFVVFVVKSLPHDSKIGCLTESFLARMSSIFGSPFMTLAMAILVAS